MTDDKNWFPEWDNLSEFEKGYVRCLRDMDKRFSEPMHFPKTVNTTTAIPRRKIKAELEKLSAFARNRRLGGIGSETGNPMKVMGRTNPNEMKGNHGKS